MDSFQLQEICISGSDNENIPGDENINQYYIIQNDSVLKESILDNFLEDELGMKEIKKIKKDFIMDQVNSLSKEEGEKVLENIKSKYVCVYIKS